MTGKQITRQPRLINKRPHPIHVYDTAGEVLLYTLIPVPPSLQADEALDIDWYTEDTPIYTIRYQLDDLPPYRQGTYYVVSNVIKLLYPERPDLLIPVRQVRDAEGRVIGCRGFAQKIIIDPI